MGIPASKAREFSFETSGYGLAIGHSCGRHLFPVKSKMYA